MLSTYFNLGACRCSTLASFGQVHKPDIILSYIVANLNMPAGRGGVKKSVVSAPAGVGYRIWVAVQPSGSLYIVFTPRAYTKRISHCGPLHFRGNIRTFDSILGVCTDWSRRAVVLQWSSTRQG